MRLTVLLFCAALIHGSPIQAAETSPQPGSVYEQANGHFRTGSGLASRKDFAAAAPEFQAAVRLNPKFGAAYYWLGICDFMRDDSGAAIGDFKAALVNTRDTNLLSMIHYDLGIQYLKTGDRASADAEYRSAVLLNPALSRHPMPGIPPSAAAAPPPPNAAATVQGKFQTTYRTKHGHYVLQHLTLAYTPASGQSRTADLVVGDSSSIAVGQTLPIHYLSDHPDWAALDDDVGYSSKQGRAALIAGSFVGLALALGLILSLPGLRKERALLRMGQARGAYVESVAGGGKGYAAAVFSFEFMGQIRHVRSLVAIQHLEKPLQAGQVLTVLVDPAAPDSFAVYKASSYRVASM